MKDQTRAPVDTSRQPVQPAPGAPYTVIPTPQQGIVRETVPEDLNPGVDGWQTARPPAPFKR
jgi:hypothetical protein